MRKTLFVFSLIFLFTVCLHAQTPQFYNYQHVGSQNTFPLGQSGGKAVCWLFLPGAFTQPSPCPQGQQITTIYGYVGTGGTRTYTNFHILLAQDTITNMTQGQFPSESWDTVYFRNSITFIGTTNSWGYLHLDHPFPYDPNKSFLLQMEHCGATAGTGIWFYQNNLGGVKRVWSVGGCPFTPYSGGDGYTINAGIDVEPVPMPPDLVYYKFENNPSSNMTLNCGSPGVGNNPAMLSGTTALTSGGQFDSCIVGNGTSNGGVVTGWNCDFGTGSWTISMWVTIPTTNSGSAFYIFGDPGSGSFRCFHNGVAGANNLLLRGPLTQVQVNGIGPSPTVVTFVYDSAAHNIKAYKNGVLTSDVNNTLNMTTGSGFKVGGYGTSATFVGKLDEFRVYRRALNAFEVGTMWNQDITCGIVTGFANQHSKTPMEYKLSQNYPNPFNPTTKISYALQKAGNVKLIVYDVLGREVSTLVNEFKTAGYYTADFDATNLASGIYLYRIEAGTFKDTKKMLLIK